MTKMLNLKNMAWVYLMSVRSDQKIWCYPFPQDKFLIRYATDGLASERPTDTTAIPASWQLDGQGYEHRRPKTGRKPATELVGNLKITREIIIRYNVMSVYTNGKRLCVLYVLTVPPPVIYSHFPRSKLNFLSNS